MFRSNLELLSLISRRLRSDRVSGKSVNQAGVEQRRGWRRRQALQLLALEQLENRQLLAVNITSQADLGQYLQNGTYTISDSTSIVIGTGVDLTLDAGAAAISLSAPSIEIKASTTIKTAGNFTINASAVLPYIGLPAIVDMFVRYIPVNEAKFTVGEKASLQANSVTIDVTAGDGTREGGKVAKGLIGGGVDGIIGGLLSQLGLNELFSLPIGVGFKQPRASITVASDASINAEQNVTIKGTSSAYSMLFSTWAAMENLFKVQWGFGAAIGVNYTDASTTTTIAGSIEAKKGKVDISTDTYSYNNMRSNVGLNLGIAPTNPDAIAAAVSVSIEKSQSSIDVSQSASINALGTVAIQARANNQLVGEAYTASYGDGLAGFAVGVGVTSADVHVTVDGTVIAGATTAPASLQFDPSFVVNFDNSSIDLPTDTQFQTGDELVYSTNGGLPIPGLRSGELLYAIVDPANRRSIRLARTAVDAAQGRAISFGAAYPTLTSASGQGTLPIFSITSNALDTLEFTSNTWPDGQPLVDGQKVSYKSAPGRFVGYNDPTTGQLIGQLPDGEYTIRLMPDPNRPGTHVALVGADGVQVNFNINPQFRLADGTLLQASSIDPETEAVSFLFPEPVEGVDDRPPDQQAALGQLANAVPLIYTAALGQTVSGLVDGQTYYAVWYAKRPGAVRLAATELQARAADPALANAHPTLTVSVPAESGGPEVPLTFPIESLEPSDTLAFSFESPLPDGTPVVYHEVPGQPIHGLLDGQTYYIYSRANPEFNPSWPQYLYGLRSAPDNSLPYVQFSFAQYLEVNGTRYVIGSRDPESGLMELVLPQAATLTGANTSKLIGGTASIMTIPAGTARLWTEATGGTLAVMFADPGSPQGFQTARISAFASAADIVAAINGLGIAGVHVGQVLGRGRAESPWMILGTGLDSLQFDDSGLTGGLGRAVIMDERRQAVWTTASGGNFTLRVDVGGSTRSTGPIQPGASGAEIEAALQAAGAVNAKMWGGAGTSLDPWIVSLWDQPLATGANAVFRDGWGTTSLGLLSGHTYRLVVQKAEWQVIPGSVIVGLQAETGMPSDPNEPLLGLGTTIAFGGDPSPPPLTGSLHSLQPTASSGITITATGTFTDSLTVGTQIGAFPTASDLLSTRKEGLISLFRRGEKWQTLLSPLRALGRGIANILWNPSFSDQGWNAIQQELAGQRIEHGNTVKSQAAASASVSVLVGSRTVLVTIGEHARISTPGNLVVKSSLTENFQSAADANVTKPRDTGLAMGLGVDVPYVATTCRTLIAANAELNGGQQVIIGSEVWYPWIFGDWKRRWSADDTGGFSKFLSSITVDLNMRHGTHSSRTTLASAKDQLMLPRVWQRPDYPADAPWYKNVWSFTKAASSYVWGTNDLIDGVDPRIDVAVAGGIQVVTINNTCETVIEQGARINTPTKPVSVDSKAQQKVTITANTYLDQLSWASGFTADTNKGIGACIAYIGLTNTTRAIVGADPGKNSDGTQRIAGGPAKITFGDGGFTVGVDSYALFLQLARGGSVAGSFGFSGQAAVVDVKSNIQALVTWATRVNARPSTSGTSDIHANDTSYLIPLAGVPLPERGNDQEWHYNGSAANTAIGVSTAVGLLSRQVTAQVGSAGVDPPVGSGNTFSLGGPITVSAQADGAVTPNALAGVNATTAPQGEPQQAPRASGNAAGGQQPANGGQPVYGVGVSGDVSVARVNDTVLSLMTGVLINSPAVPSPLPSLKVTAKNLTVIEAFAGSAVWMGGDGASLGLAGSAAVITADSTVQAGISNSSIQGFALTVDAKNARNILGLAASGSGKSANEAKGGVQAAASVVVNQITAKTKATVDHVNGSWLDTTQVDATDDDTALAVAGSFLANFHLQKDAGDEAWKSVGFGAAVAYQSVTSTTDAEILDMSSLTLIAGALRIQAQDNTAIRTIAASGAGSGAGIAISGSSAINRVDSNTNALVDGQSLIDTTAVDETTEGSVMVAAASALTVLAIAGDVLVSYGKNSKLAFGASITDTEARILATGKIKDSTVRTRQGKGQVSVLASSTNPPRLDSFLDNLYTPGVSQSGIWSYAIGAGLSNADWTLAFSYSRNDVTMAQTAAVERSTIEAGKGGLRVVAVNDVRITAVAGSVAGSSNRSEGISGAAGGALALNLVRGLGASATITGSTVTLANPGDVIVTALNGEGVIAIAVGAAVTVSGEKNFDVGFSVALNQNGASPGTPNATTKALIEGSTISGAGNVTVTAGDATRLLAIAGQVAVASSGTAAGSAAAQNQLSSVVTAQILDCSKIEATSTVTVQAAAVGSIQSFAVGVAVEKGSGKINLAGVGSGTGNELSRQINALVSHSTVTTGTLNILATDDTQITTVAGALAIQITKNPPPRQGDRERNRQGGELLDGNAAGAQSDQQSENSSVIDPEDPLRRPSQVRNSRSDSMEFQVESQASFRSLSQLSRVSAAGPVSAAAGISASRNKIGNYVTDAAGKQVKDTWVVARLENSTVTTDTLVVDAVSKARLIAVTEAGAFGSNSSGGFAFYGAGAGSGNQILQDVRATVIGTTVASKTQGATNAKIDVLASSQTLISAWAGGQAVAGARPGAEASAGVNVSVGSAAVVNTVDLATLATVDSSTLGSHGSVTVQATAENQIFAVAFGVAGSVKLAGGQGGSTAVDFTGAGSAAYNKIKSVTQAVVTNKSLVGSSEANAAVGSMTVQAKDISRIFAITGALSFSGSGQAKQVSPSVGMSWSVNDIHDSEIRAAVEQGSTVYASGDVTISAGFDKPADGHTIQAVSVAGVVEAQGSPDGAAKGFMFLGAGAGNGNYVNVSIVAALSSGASVSAGGDVRIEATNAADIDSNAGGLGLGIQWGKGDGRSVRVGAAVSRNEVHISTLATLADWTKPDQTQVANARSLVLKATNNAYIQGVAYGVAGGLNLQEGSPSWGVDLAGAGSSSTNSVTGDTQALIQKGATVGTSSSRVGKVELTAISRPAIYAFSGAFAPSFSNLSQTIMASVGASYSINTVSGKVQSQIDGGTVWSKDTVSLTAQLDKPVVGSTIHAISVAGVASVAGSAENPPLSLAFLGAGAGNGNFVDICVDASITSGASVSALGQVSLAASNSADIDSNAGGLGLNIQWDTGNSGSLKVGAAVSRNVVNIATQATMGNLEPASSAKVMVTAAEGLTLTATNTGHVQGVAYGVTGGLDSTKKGSPAWGVDLAGAGSSSTNTVTGDTLAKICGGSEVGSSEARVGAVSLEATRKPSIYAFAGAFSPQVTLQSKSVISSVGVSYSINSVSGVIEASVDQGKVYASGPVQLKAAFGDQSGSATGSPTIRAVSVAGMLDLGAGKDLNNLPSSVRFGGAGAGNGNTVAMNVTAGLKNATVDTTNVLTLEATDTATIDSNAGGVDLGFSLLKSNPPQEGKPQPAKSYGFVVGAAHDENTVNNAVATVIDQSKVQASSLAATASSQPRITSLGFGVALDVRIPGPSLAGSGAGIVNTVKGGAGSTISRSTVSTTADVNLSATGKPQVDARAGSGTLAAGSVFGLAVGAVDVRTTVAQVIQSGIDVDGVATADANNASSLTLAGALNVTAASQADVSQLAVGVAVSGSSSVAGAGAGTGVNAEIQNAVTARIGSGVITASAVTVLATAADAISSNLAGSGALGVGAYSGTVGVSLASSSINDTLIASVGVEPTRVSSAVAAPSVTATGSGGITVSVVAGNTVKSFAVPTSLAISFAPPFASFAGAGGQSYATDSSSFSAQVTGGAKLTAPKGALTVTSVGRPVNNPDPGPVPGENNSTDGGTIDAQAHLGAVGIWAAIGAVVARATSMITRSATIADQTDLSHVQALVLVASATPRVSTYSIGVDVGGLAVLVNESRSMVAGSVTAKTGDGVILPHDVLVAADAAPRITAEQTGVSAGALAAGGTVTYAEDSIQTTALLGSPGNPFNGQANDPARLGTVRVQAVSRNTRLTANSVSGTGGALAGGGTRAEVTDKTRTNASVSGTIETETFIISANRMVWFDHYANAANVSAAGVGVALAYFVDNATVDVELGRTVNSVIRPVTIDASGLVTVQATHQISKLSQEEAAWGWGGQVAGGGDTRARSEINNATATVTIRDGSTIRAVSGPIGTPAIIVAASAALNVLELAYTNVGGGVTGAATYASVTGTVIPTVKVGDNVRLESAGSIEIGTAAAVNASSSAHTQIYSLVGGSGGFATTDVQVKQGVTFGKKAAVHAGSRLAITVGEEQGLGTPNQQTGSSSTDVRAYGLFAFTSASSSVATSKIRNTLNLSFDEGADVWSGGGLYLAAQVNVPANSVQAYAPVWNGIPGDGKTYFDTTQSSSIKLRGNFVAGKNNKVEITINQPYSSALPRISSPDLDSTALANVARVVSSFDPRAFVNNRFTGDVRDVLLAGVSTAKNGVVTFAPLAANEAPGAAGLLTPLQVSGGSVTVDAGNAGTIDAAGATIEGRVGKISIKNTTAYDLVLGSLSIANVRGGEVTLLSRSATDPVGATVKRDSSTPLIEVSQQTPASTAAFGPSVFQAGPISNPGGDVTIFNNLGSFGQTDTIAARSITISTPNGVFAVDMPNADWSAAGTPAAQVQNSLFWPGLDPFTSNPEQRWNANWAAVFAVNAMSDFDSTWSQTTITQRLYGRYDNGFGVVKYQNDNSSFVFFGSSVPYVGEGKDSRLEATITAGKISSIINYQPGSESSSYLPNDSWKASDPYLIGKYNPPFSSQGYLSGIPTVPSTFVWPIIYEAPRTTNAIAARSVVINAKTVNINGTIVAGRIDSQGNPLAATGSSVVLDAEAAAWAAKQKDAYDAGLLDQAIVPIPHELLSGTADIGASFDCRNGSILIDEADTSGSGQVSITGRIFNTSRLSGRIKVSAGSGNIDVTNNTPYTLDLGSLRTVGDTNSARVTLNDLNRSGSEVQTAYVYDSTGLRCYVGAQGQDLPATTQPVWSSGDSTTNFSPVAGLRWGWQEQTSLHRDVIANPGSGTWSGVNAGQWTWVNKDTPWQTVGGTAGELVVNPDLSEQVRQTLSATWSASVRYTDPTLVSRGTYEYILAPYKTQAGQGGWRGIDLGFSADRKYYFPTDITMTMTNSLKASYPIAIDFTGTSFGKIMVHSQGTVVLDQPIAGSSVFIQSNGEIHQQTTDNPIKGTSVTLLAGSGLGTALAPLVVETGRLTASTDTGSVFIDANPDAVRGLVIDRASAAMGLVSIRNSGDITAGQGVGGVHLSAPAVTLQSQSGSVGSESRPLILESPTTIENLRLVLLNAFAGQDIYMRQATGDLLVQRVTASDGLVSLDSPGSIYDANTWTYDPEKLQAHVAELVALGYTDPNAYLQHQSRFESEVTSNYQLYWQLLDSGNVLDGGFVLDSAAITNWTPRTAQATGKAPDEVTLQEVQTYTNDLYGTLIRYFDANLVAGWRDTAPFQTFDQSWRYHATAAQIEAFRANRPSFSQEQLLVTFDSESLAPATLSKSVPGEANVVARDVRLAARAGSIGKVGEPISIPLDRIRSGKISDFERLILALAGRPGDARLLDSNTLQITLNRPLIVDTLGGQFDAVAARGVSAAEKTGDLLVRRVSATVGPVKLIADGKIFKSGSAVTFFSNLVESNQVSNWVVQGNATAALADSQQAVVLAIPSSATSSSAAWLSKPVSLQAFRADFEIVPGGTRGHEDLAFILQTVGTGVVGQPLAGAGVAGIPGRKIAVQISLDSSRRNRPSVRISGLGRGIRSSRLGFPLTGGALYVTIAYDPARKSFEVTVADRIAGKPGCKQKTIYVKGDLSAALSSQTATVGFTSGTSKQPIFAQIQNFNFATDSNASRIAGNHIAFGKGNVADWRDSNKAPGTYWKFRSPSALSFQSRTPGTRDAITWYQEAVSTGSFQLNFDVDLPPASRRPDRLTFSLVPANSSDTRDNLTLSSLDSRSFSFALDLLGHKAGIEATRLAGTMESVGDLRLASGRVHVILQYDATRHTFSINLTDSRGRQFTQTFEGIDLLSILGADAAWIGFGSSGPSTHQSKLTIRDLRFLQPGKVSDGVNSWKLMGGIQSISGELLTVPDEATAATASWYPHLLSTGGFTATFDYRLNLRGTRRAAGGSGMALVLQTDPAGPQAVSATTAGFGYRDIAGPKLGLLFGINDNGIPGVQLNQGSVSGKFLKVPWLASGKVSMTIVYDETTHAISLTLRNSRGSVFEHTWTEMDLGKVLGGYVGWLGFTSGCTRKALAQHIGNFRWFSLGAIRSLGGSSAVSLLSLQNGTSDTTPVTE